MSKICVLAAILGCGCYAQHAAKTPEQVEVELERQLQGLVDRTEIPVEVASVGVVRPREQPSGESVSVYSLKHKISKAARKSYLRARKISKSGDHAGAAAELESTVRIDPLFAIAYNQLGVEYALSGRVAEARKAFERAIELDPDSWSHQYNLSLVLFQLGDRSGAERQSRRALQLASDQAQPHWLLGYLLYGDESTRAQALEHLRYAARTIKEAKLFLRAIPEK